jgi:hypothetical protein
VLKAGLAPPAAPPPAAPPPAPPPAPRPAAPPGAVRGVDVAAFQHPVTAQFPQGAPIGWAQVARSGIQFAAIKATEGSYYVNPFYAADRAGARAARLAVIAYGFANPKPKCGTAAGQAQYLVSHARGTGAGPVPPLMLDIEYNAHQAPADHLHHAGLVGQVHRRQHRARGRTGLGRRLHRRDRPARAGGLDRLGTVAVHQFGHGARHRG